MIHKEVCPNCSTPAIDCIEFIPFRLNKNNGKHYCHYCSDYIEDTTLWVKAEKRLPQGDERRVLIKTDNGRGGHWINIAWWRPSANCFDDGLSVDFWCEIPH